jgi:4-coumarate--CoA ligase
MPLKSRWTVPIPNYHLASYVFQSPTHPLSKTQRCLLEAERPDSHYFTVHDFRLWSQRFAAGLRKSGVKPGDRILFYSGNDLFYLVVFFGTIMAGAIFTGANPTYLPRELAYQLKDSEATYLICGESSLDAGIAAAEQIGMSRDKIFVFNNALYDGQGEGQKGCRYWGELIASEEEGRQFAWDPLDTPEAADTILALNYSSGTTGKAKGVEITHKNYVANALQTRYVIELDPDLPEKDKKARWLGFLPMYHAFGQTYAVAAVHRRIPLYVMPRFDFIKVLEYIERFRISTLYVVPPVVVALAKHPAVKKYDLSSVQSIGCGAAPLGRETCEEAEALWKGAVNIKQGWGMTE